MTQEVSIDQTYIKYKFKNTIKIIIINFLLTNLPVIKITHDEAYHKIIELKSTTIQKCSTKINHSLH